MDMKACVEEIANKLTAEWDQGQFGTILAAVVASSLIGIREAIVEHGARLAGEQEHWDESALAKIASDMSRHDQALGAQLYALHESQGRLGALERRIEALEGSVQGQTQVNQILLDGGRVHAGKIAALETAVQNVLEHQQETAALMTELAEKGPARGAAAG